MKQNILILWFTLLIPFVSTAQNRRVYVTEGIGTTMIETSKNYNKTTFYDSFWDFDSDFKYGILYLKNGDSIDNLGIRYNITRDRFETVSSIKPGIFIVNPDAISRIKRMSELFTYFKFYNATGKLSKGYFKVVYDGNTKLFYRKAEKHKEGKQGAFGYSSFKQFSTNFYLKKPGEQYPVLIKKEKADILAQLNDKKKLVEAFAAENNLNYKKVNDLIKILKYYDSL